MPTPNYFLETARTASFKTQRRTSAAKGGNQFKWPHKTMPPIKFVKAGFYFAPDAEHPDNVTCYLCNKSLDGWEPEDDPTAEHYRHSPDCGAAITAYTEAIPDGSYTSDPHSEGFANARLMTFGQGLWPHEHLPNLCTEMMANAGFHYAPTKDEPDYCLCPFCGVSLANFEPEDDPRMEHYRRAPNCYFFKTEPKRGKRGSRTSTVPRGRRASRATSVAPEPPVERGRSRDSNDLADDEEPPAKKQRGKRAGSVKPKAGGRRVGRKKAVADYTESINSVSDAEEPPKRGRKRSSSVFDSNEPVVLFDGRASTDEEDQIVVQPKKRATRASVARGGGIDTMAPPRRQRATRASIAARPTVDYGTLTDAEDAMATKPVKGRRTVSKTQKSTSKPKTYVPVDQDLDNSLVQDEPPTDEDDSAPHQKPFVRSTKRPTKSRTSLAIEQQMRDAPNDVLVPAAGKAKSKTPRAGTRDPGVTGTPLRPFFRDDQDFSMPVSVPRHLNRDIEILDQHSDAPSEAEDSAPEAPVKRGRGRPRKMSVTAEASKPKRTKATKKGVAARSKSRTSESERPTVTDTLEEAPPAELIQSPPREIEPEIEPVPAPEQTEEPQRGRKKQRESVASVASIIADDPPHPDVPEDSENYSGETTIPNSESEQHSDADSVVRHVVEVRDSIHTNDGESSPELPAEEAQASEPEQPVSKPTRKSPRKSSPAKAQEMPQPSSPPQGKPLPEPETAPAPIDHDTDVSEVFLPESLHGTPAKDTPRQHQSPERAERQSSEVSRASVSPVRKQLTIPLVTTPQEKVRTLQSSRPWNPADLDAVFATSDDDEEEVAGLTAAERAMTVEEWVKWNAANAERRLTERAEKMIAMFEQKGREAMACIEGIPTTS